MKMFQMDNLYKAFDAMTWESQKNLWDKDLFCHIYLHVAPVTGKCT